MQLQETTINCPYCGEMITVLLDDSEAEQQYVEDCQVCCRPIVLRVYEGGHGELGVEVFHEDDAI